MFDPEKEKENQWKEIPEDAPGCPSVRIELQVIKDFTFEIDTEIIEKHGESGKKEKKKK